MNAQNGFRPAAPGELKIKRYHHHAFKAPDIEKTRWFYEDVLGLPCVAAFIEDDSVIPELGKFVHVFYQLDDGSYIAFFHFANQSAIPEMPSTNHHLALAVDRDGYDRIKRRYEEVGQEYSEIDHGFCQSIYTRDPGGMRLEFSCDTNAEIMKMRKTNVRVDIQNCMNGIYEHTEDVRFQRIAGGDGQT